MPLAYWAASSAACFLAAAFASASAVARLRFFRRVGGVYSWTVAMGGESLLSVGETDAFGAAVAVEVSATLMRSERRRPSSSTYALRQSNMRRNLWVR